MGTRARAHGRGRFAAAAVCAVLACAASGSTATAQCPREWRAAPLFELDGTARSVLEYDDGTGREVWVDGLFGLPFRYVTE